MNDHHKLTEDMDNLIASIGDQSIRDFTHKMVYSVSLPWQRPASTRHHLQDEREPFGNLLHSVRVSSLCRLILSAVIVNLAGFPEVVLQSLCDDVLLSAATLHDMCRHGLFDEADSSLPKHPQLVRLHAMQHGFTCIHFDAIMSVIESHMGKWSDPPVYLEIDAHTALHLADCIVARWAEVMPSGESSKL